MSVGRASLFMIVTLVASRFLGWLRLSVIGAKFGETGELDAFWAAFRIPDTLFNLLVAGALASAFIPVFTGYLAREREDEAWRVASSVMNAIVILLIALSALMWLLAPWIVPVLAPFGDPAQVELTIRLSRIMLLSPIFMGLSALFTGILNSYRQFLSGATAPLVYNFVIILFAVFASPFLGIATLAEAVLFLVLLAPRARLRIVGLGTASLKVVAASLLMGIAMFAFIRATNITVDLQQTKLGLLLQTLVAVAVGAV